MPFDGCSGRRPWHEDFPPRFCRSCNRPITVGEPSEQLLIDGGDVHNLHRLNGSYHAACAKPLMSLLRAYEAATRLTG